MDKIRLGNDIEMRWSIFTRDGDNKVPYNLEGRALTLSVVNRTGESEIEFFAEGNIVTGVFRGRDQRILGKHGVILRENNGENGMRTIDACDAFELVACSCEEALGSPGTIQLFHLTFDSTIGAITGTIDPILNHEAEQAEAERKTNEIIRKANEQQRIDNEKQRNANEILRNIAEEERKNAEQERIVNEDLRKADEAERKTNEESRVKSESERVSSEEERLYAESIRVANENARIASEAKRAEAETARIEAEDKRIVSEKNRLSAESSRIANEDSRRANEDSRLSAEAKRVSAETKRVSAEEERQIAEEERKAKFASMVVQSTGDATDKVMSQKAVTEALKGKQEKLVAGDNITIEGNVINSTGGGSIDLSAYAKQADVDAALAGKQSALTDTDGGYGQRVAELETGKADKATTLAGYGIADAYTKSELDALLNGKQDTLTAGNGISIEGGVISSTVDSLITPITYAELVALRDSSSLVAGMQYRITDYTCTTTQENTQSAGHPFDIIVTADSENTLNEESRAIQHEGDTYFADCDLNAWKIWYCLDNDATRFAWADGVNGKGVIYRMIDEWNNDVPYDFKNIMYNGSWGYWAYTFNWINDESDNTCEDLSVAQYVHTNDEGIYSHTYGNIIKPYGGGYGGKNGYPLQLNVNIFLNSESYDGGWFYGCSSNAFGNGCSSNTFGNVCYSNTFGDECSYNILGDFCQNNTFGDECSYNILGDFCQNNTFGNSCQNINFASSSSATTKYNFYQHNHFGDGCQYILFKGAETASNSAQVQNYNFAQGLGGTSSAYLTIDGVRSRAYETKVAKNSSGELKIYCEADLIQ